MRRARYAGVVEDSEVGHVIAEAIGALVRRDARTQLHRKLTENLGEAVDAVTYPVLSGLARTGPRSAADLAEAIGLDRSGVTRRATRLEEAGLVRREPDPDDRRATLLLLTDAGHATVEVMRDRLARSIEQSLAAWPAERARDFAESLRRFVAEGPFTHGS